MARAGMERWRDRLALVTGASGGIGAAVARALVQQGLKVVGCARTVSNIEELAAECKSAGYPGTLIPYRCDLSNEEDILSMFSAVRSQHSGVDICINNAGLARPDPLLSGSTSGWKDMFNVNVLALSICTREAYQSMKERKVDDGHIININSMSGHRVVPQSVIHFYSATKYAVTALTEGLRHELREAQTHIRATCLKPEDVAEAVIYVLSTPPHVQYLPFDLGKGLWPKGGLPPTFLYPNSCPSGLGWQREALTLYLNGYPGLQAFSSPCSASPTPFPALQPNLGVLGVGGHHADYGKRTPGPSSQVDFTLDN
ncbi:dehydrogenase/reductase SDR family member 11 isoform X2 [Trichechus manatus latirostris]|uniref:Dehydrogenase/reductase SDR family member 11 n=1 Tax=Trichechus manatus latirostris TaxID=127582 RepID=A0A2Y9QYL9_TRIMA|nr:dehydrogenase/reductase SDR family member 11 isoform X2 [Trichechus manatus latirostris]